MTLFKLNFCTQLHVPRYAHKSYPQIEYVLALIRHDLKYNIEVFIKTLRARGRIHFNHQKKTKPATHRPRHLARQNFYRSLFTLLLATDYSAVVNY